RSPLSTPRAAPSLLRPTAPRQLGDEPLRRVSHHAARALGRRGDAQAVRRTGHPALRARAEPTRRVSSAWSVRTALAAVYGRRRSHRSRTAGGSGCCWAGTALRVAVG